MNEAKGMTAEHAKQAIIELLRKKRTFCLHERNNATSNDQHGCWHLAASTVQTIINEVSALDIGAAPPLRGSEGAKCTCFIPVGHRDPKCPEHSAPPPPLSPKALSAGKRKPSHE